MCKEFDFQNIFELCIQFKVKFRKAPVVCWSVDMKMPYST